MLVNVPAQNAVMTAERGIIMLKNLQAIINLHDKMKGSYFYHSPSSASSRRSYEKYNSLTTEFEFDGQQIRVEQGTRCSCKNVYYSMSIYINGVCGKDIRFIKKLLKSFEMAA